MTDYQLTIAVLVVIYAVICYCMPWNYEEEN